jgi:thioredoxin reductase
MGNSAGQAAVFLASFAKHVHLLVRGPGLAEKRASSAAIGTKTNVTTSPARTGTILNQQVGSSGRPRDANLGMPERN